VRYCDAPAALRRAAAGGHGADGADREREEEDRIREREAARDTAVRAWAATARGVESWELALLARERIRALTSEDGRLLGRLGGWLGADGSRLERAMAARASLARAGERRLVQLWFLLEVANATQASVVPPGLRPWLERLGFVDPEGPPPRGFLGQPATAAAGGGLGSTGTGGAGSSSTAGSTTSARRAGAAAAQPGVAAATGGSASATARHARRWGASQHHDEGAQRW
jgi:hypothetical protein